LLGVDLASADAARSHVARLLARDQASRVLFICLVRGEEIVLDPAVRP
jgi:hypothetical protein